MTLSYWQRTQRAADVTCEVAVVGGGIIGCATAYWLRRLRPGLRVAVVEAGRLAAGASGRNAGFLLQGTTFDYETDRASYGPVRARRLWQFTRENRDLLFAELEAERFELEGSGSLAVAGTETEGARLQEAVSHMRADGTPVAYLPPDEMNRRLSARHFHGGLYVPSGAMMHPVKLVAYLAAASEAEVLTHHRVVALGPAPGGVLLETPRRRIVAGQVVLALNAYLPQLLPSLGRYVRPVRAQMLATAPLPTRWLPGPAYTHEGYFYIRQAPDGAVLLGGARHLHREAEVGYGDATTPALQADLEAYLLHHFPQMQGHSIQQRWGGTMGFSPDHLPVVGEVAEVPGVLWAAGFTGHGMGYGFRFGRMLAEQVVGVARPEGMDLFSVERFADVPASAGQG